MKKIVIATGVAVLAFASLASAAFNVNLTVGSTGADVVALQTWLMANGYSIPSLASGAATPGYFGSQTKAAVMAYQSKNGIPNTGFVGPLTRAALNAGGGVAVTPGVVVCPAGYVCSPVGGGTTPPVSTGGLSGTDGTISDVQELSQYNNEEVGDGESDVKVLGMEVEASSDGDIRIRSIKVSFDATGNSGSDNLDDYIEGVSVWFGSNEVGSADVSGFTENDDVWTRTITLSGNTVVKADDAEDIFVAVDAVNNFDSSDISGDSWTVDVESIRFEDGSGVLTTESSEGDLGSMDVPINFVDFATAADTELKFSTDSSNPEGTIVMVDDSDTTDNVVLLVGKMKLDGTSDVTIDELPITFTVGGTATGLASTTGSVILKINGEEYTESVGNSFNSVASSVTFDNLDLDVNAGSTVTFTVLADIASVDGNLTEGDVLKASFTASNRAMVDAENEEGDQLGESEKSGTVTGNFMEFRTEGIGATLVTSGGYPSATSNNNDGADTGTFKIRYTVTAFGDTVYIASLAANAVTYAVYDQDGVATTATSISASLQNETDSSKTSVGNFEIEDGETETFTLTITVPNGLGDASAQYFARLTGILWDLTDDITPSTTYSSDLDEFQTPTVFLDRI